MVFQILKNGIWVDIVPYIAFQGLEYQLSDIDDTDAGRNMAGTMMRGKIADKDKWMIKFKPVTTATVSMLIQLVSEEYITCRYTSPRTGELRSGVTMYVGDRKSTHALQMSNDTLWSGLAFNLIER